MFFLGYLVNVWIESVIFMIVIILWYRLFRFHDMIANLFLSLYMYLVDIIF